MKSSENADSLMDVGADSFEDSWSHVEFPGNFGFGDNHGFDSDVHDFCGQPAAHSGVEHGLLTPKPKPRPQNAAVRDFSSAGIKRTADEYSSHQLHRQISEMKQPWQTGLLSGAIGARKPFWEKSSLDSMFSTVGIYDHITSVDSASSIPRPVKQLQATVQRIRASRCVKTDDDFRRLSLARFKTMVLLEIDATRLGLSLLTFAGTLCTDDELAQTFSVVFSPKSSGTILKRCNSMWRFSCWLQGRGLGSPFNQSEDIVYLYLCHLRDSEAGSTTPSQFIEAVRFCNALLGFCKTTVDDMLSARVVGAAHSIYLTKRIRRPAEILKVIEVQQLEDICMQDPLLHHRVIAGHLLFCLTAAARWHDSMYVTSLHLSRAAHLTLLEAETSKHKSSRSKEQQKELLPFTALGQLLDDDSWAEAWMIARKNAGAEHWKHFLCSWSEQRHCWTDSRMSTAEASGWLREFLEPTEGAARASSLTAHGLKATMLSWAAKSLLFTPEEQLALGHHVSSHYKSALIYSRDNQIGLCKKIYEFLEKIKDGTFKPDGNRVQRLL